MAGRCLALPTWPAGAPLNAQMTARSKGCASIAPFGRGTRVSSQWNHRRILLRLIEYDEVLSRKSVPQCLHRAPAT